MNERCGFVETSASASSHGYSIAEGADLAQPRKYEPHGVLNGTELDV